MSTWLRRHAPDLGMLAYIAALVLARSWHRELTVDVHVYDESWYLANGVQLWTRGLPPPDWAPLYAVWYWLESLLVSDRLVLYYANWSALLFLNLLAAWLIMRRLQCATLVSVVVLAALAVAGSFELVLNVTMLASALVGFATAAALGRKTLSGAFAAAASFVVLAAYVRPELSTAFALLFLASIVASFVERRPWAAVPFAIGAAAFLLLGNPLGDGSRRIVAFGQNYAINANAALPVDQQVQRPMVLWRRFVEADFGPVQSVGEALRAAPRAFLWHVGQNAERLLRSFAAPVTPVIPLGTFLGWMLLGLIVTGLVVAARTRSRSSLVAMAVAFAAVSAEAFGALLVSPHLQYLMIPVIAVVGAALSASRSEQLRWNGRAVVAVAILILMVVPGHAGAAPWYLPSEARPLPLNLTMARSVRALHAMAPGFPLLADPAHVSIYSDWSSQPVGLESCPELAKCIGDMGAVIVDTAFFEFYLSRHDPMLPVLLTQPGRVGCGDRRELAPGIFLLARPGVLGRP